MPKTETDKILRWVDPFSPWLENEAVEALPSPFCFGNKSETPSFICQTETLQIEENLITAIEFLGILNASKSLKYFIQTALSLYIQHLNEEQVSMLI